LKNANTNFAWVDRDHLENIQPTSVQEIAAGLARDLRRN
jgi:hypothetical protein